MTAALDTIDVRKDIYSITNDDWRNRDSFVGTMPRMLIDITYLLTFLALLL